MVLLCASFNVWCCNVGFCNVGSLMCGVVMWELQCVVL